MKTLLHAIRTTSLAIGMLCLLPALAMSQDMEWIIPYDNNLFSEARAVVSDPITGDTYVGGSIESTSDVGPWEGTDIDVNTAGMSSGTDAFIAKFSAAGGLDYIKFFGGSGDDCILDLAIGVDGNIYGTGYFSGDFSLQNLDGSELALAATLSSPLSPSNTILIFSSEENFRLVLLFTSLIRDSELLLFFLLITR